MLWQESSSSMENRQHSLEKYKPTYLPNTKPITVYLTIHSISKATRTVLSGVVAIPTRWLTPIKTPSTSMSSVLNFENELPTVYSPSTANGAIHIFFLTTTTSLPA